MGKWLDQLQSALTGPPAAQPESMGEQLLSVPELQNSHGGSFVSGMVHGLGDAAQRLVGLADYTGQVARGQGPDPRSDEGIDRIAGGAVGMAELGTMLPGEAGALGMFAGRNSQTANLQRLGEAERLAAAGAPERKVWDDTGWFRGADGGWRYEIDDSRAQLGANAVRDMTAGGPVEMRRPIAAVLQHADLYRAYPEARRGFANVAFDPEGRVSGSYNPWGNQPEIGVSANGIGGVNGPRSILLHEMQHDIQNREGFLMGHSPDEIARLEGGLDPRDAYMRQASEVEARNVMARRNMTPDERRAKAPWETEDVPRDRQIVRR